MPSLHVIRFCAEECQRQQSGEMSVYWMVTALSQFESIWCYSHECVQELGRLIEPRKNANGYRTVPVMIGDKVLPADNIKHQMDLFLRELARHPEELSPKQAYKEFEEIHPFIDGNGRLGAIIYNWLNGTLDDLQPPPDVFNKEVQ